VVSMSKPLYFYSHRKKEGFLSQFYPCTFEVDGETYCCAEQWMMAQKAALMGDTKTRVKVMAETNPIKIKSLGRRVKPWNQDKWEKKRFSIVLEGNLHKFSQNEHLRQKLKKTGRRTIVEAAANDYVWGIGISFKNAVKGDKWRGMNLLGKVLMKVRKKLLKH
jgi:ribA/ribD-fused uncharacterized protein